MPIYEYVCKKKHRFIKVVKMDESKIITKCPQCDSNAIRQMSRFTPIVKDGTGRFHK